MKSVFNELLAFDQSLKTNFKADYIIGIDEVGRGCLFGPVVASAICFLELEKLDPTKIDKINDSKKINHKTRTKLVQEISKLCIWSIGCASHKEIDTINIHNASLLAMSRAYNSLWNKLKNIHLAFEKSHFLVTIDGKYLISDNSQTINQIAIIKGDLKSFSIATASIIAKVYRDNLITKLSTQYSCYSLEKNKGYPTKLHKLAIQKYGLSNLHRQSFKYY